MVCNDDFGSRVSVRDAADGVEMVFNHAVVIFPKGYGIASNREGDFVGVVCKAIS